MISLLNVLKQSAVVFTDDVYQVEIREPEPVIPEIIQPQTLPAVNNVSIDEEAVWNRLKERLEEERKAVIKAANEEAGFIRNRAYNEGYERGVQEKMGEIQSLIDRNEKLLHNISISITEKLREYEKNLTELSVDIASKVLARKLDEDNQCMNDLIRKAVDEVKNSEWISITLSDELKQVLGGLEEELRRGKFAGKLDIMFKEAPKGTCIVETPDGVIDASIHTQIENLKSFFI